MTLSLKRRKQIVAWIFTAAVSLALGSCVATWTTVRQGLRWAFGTFVTLSLIVLAIACWEALTGEEAKMTETKRTETPLFVVWSVKYGRWWEPRARGYCETVERAGRYTAAECDRIEAGSQRAGRFDQISVRIPEEAL